MTAVNPPRAMNPSAPMGTGWVTALSDLLMAGEELHDTAMQVEGKCRIKQHHSHRYTKDIYIAL